MEELSKMEESKGNDLDRKVVVSKMETTTISIDLSTL